MIADHRSTPPSTSTPERVSTSDSAHVHADEDRFSDADAPIALARLRVAQLQRLTLELAKATAVDDVLAIVIREVEVSFAARVSIVARVMLDGTELEIVAGADPRELESHPYDFPIDLGQARVAGSMTVSPDGARPLDGDDRTLAVAMATECAVALERTFLVDYVRRTQIEADAARHAAEDAHRSRRDFLAVMSHELRTPLNAIAGYAELIELGIHGPINAQQLDAVQRLQRSQRHLLGLINGMLNYARVEAGGVLFDVTVVPLDEVVPACAMLMATQADVKQQQMMFSGGANRVSVQGDRERIEQVLLNLLSNAVKFTERGGSISVSYGATDGIAWVDVADTGRGLAVNQLERVFEPFVQVDSRLTRSHGGVGLGLSISRGLARGMGGDITVESTPGVGSTFHFTLPVASPLSDPA